MARGHGRAAFAFIFVTVVIDMLALGVIVPVLPKLIVAFRGGDTASGATYVGIFGTVFAAMQFLFSPVLGSLSDQYGRRRVILLSCAGLGLDYLLMASAPSLWWPSRSSRPSTRSRTGRSRPTTTPPSSNPASSSLNRLTHPDACRSP